MPEDKEFKFVQTEAEYKKGLKKGWTDEDMLRPGTYKFRRAKLPEKLKSKTKVSIYLDSEVLDYFRFRASQPNAAPYQTQINNELRKVMENGSNASKSMERDILNDKKFLRALKKKLETV